MKEEQEQIIQASTNENPRKIRESVCSKIHRKRRRLALDNNMTKLSSEHIKNRMNMLSDIADDGALASQLLNHCIRNAARLEWKTFQYEMKDEAKDQVMEEEVNKSKDLPNDELEDAGIVRYNDAYNAKSDISRLSTDISQLGKDNGHEEEEEEILSPHDSEEEIPNPTEEVFDTPIQDEDITVIRNQPRTHSPARSEDGSLPSEILKKFELSLHIPLGINIADKEDGFVTVIEFTEQASMLVRERLMIGDRVVAVESSKTGNMLPVSRASCAQSICISHSPDKPIIIRFERVVKEVKGGEDEETSSTSNTGTYANQQSIISSRSDNNVRPSYPLSDSSFSLSTDLTRPQPQFNKNLHPQAQLQQHTQSYDSMGVDLSSQIFNPNATLPSGYDDMAFKRTRQPPQHAFYGHDSQYSAAALSQRQQQSPLIAPPNYGTAGNRDDAGPTKQLPQRRARDHKTKVAVSSSFSDREEVIPPTVFNTADSTVASTCTFTSGKDPQSHFHSHCHPSERFKVNDSRTAVVDGIVKPLMDRKQMQSDLWYGRFRELTEYRNQHGNCMVAQTYKPNPSLGIWVNKQRMVYKHLQDGEKSAMTPDRLSALQSIGFVWAKQKGKPAWDDKYRKLQEYKSCHGDCLIPTKYMKDPALGRWVSTQREQYKLWKAGDHKCRLNIEKVRMLEEIGFVWRLQF